MTPLADGYHPIAPGKLATVVTFLEMTAPPPRRTAGPPPGYTLERVTHWSIREFKALYKEIGREWLWSSRLLMPETLLAARLSRPGTEAYAPVLGGRRMGVLEMDFAHPGDAEVSFFGLVPDAVGGGVGRWMMEEAIAAAFSRRGTRRLWLHTCHFDSPQALPFYQRMGFSPYARAVEVFDDARLIGRLEEDAGPHVPLIRSGRLPDPV
ncbi:MAG TPA: GNAT family N-acetyltransferase [Methylomirabilota bacterium]|nr:GNAT family N-acetyltransferase [Methylomirabilota bacterium]